jgi:phosphoribosylformimino-5-aminoimidazole carboxamide ribotide isomerase
MLIIPAIDLYNGECVRLYQGKEQQRTVFSSRPLEVARKWQAAGARLLHVVDLNGAFEGRSRNLELVREMAQTLSIPIQLGGGIRSEAQIAEILAGGIQRVVLGTIALESPALVKQICQRFPRRIVLGVDARNGRVVTRGWREASSIPATRLVKEYEDSNLAAIVFTDTSRDGTLKGPNIGSLVNMSRATSTPLIASGGISGMKDIAQLAKELPQLEGVIIGMALYTGAIDLAAVIDRYQTGGQHAG